MEELSDEEYNAEGTYRFPPNPRSWEQNAKFWATCPITDGQLREYINYYRQDYRHDPAVNEYAEVSGAPRLQPRARRRTRPVGHPGLRRVGTGPRRIPA